MPLRLRRLLPALLLLLLPLALAAESDGTPDNFTIQNFRSQQLRPDGQLDWRLAGTKAVGAGNNVQVFGAQIFMNRVPDPIRIFAASCRFNRLQHLITSDQRVHLRSRNMTVDGVGFDLDPATKVMNVHTEVRVRLYGPAVNLLHESGQTPD